MALRSLAKKIGYVEVALVLWLVIAGRRWGVLAGRDGIGWLVLVLWLRGWRVDSGRDDGYPATFGEGWVDEGAEHQVGIGVGVLGDEVGDFVDL